MPFLLCRRLVKDAPHIYESNPFIEMMSGRMVHMPTNQTNKIKLYKFHVEKSIDNKNSEIFSVGGRYYPNPFIHVRQRHKRTQWKHAKSLTCLHVTNKNVWNILKLAAIYWSLLFHVLPVSHSHSLAHWLTDWRSHCCEHEPFVDNNNNKINETQRNKKKEPFNSFIIRLKSFERTSLLILLLALRFVAFLFTRWRRTCRRKCAISRWIEWIKCGHAQMGCEWVDKCS